MKKAQQQLCVCNVSLHTKRTENPHHIHIMTLDIRPHELETMHVFYCSACHSTWMEP